MSIIEYYLLCQLKSMSGKNSINHEWPNTFGRKNTHYTKYAQSTAVAMPLYAENLLNPEKALHPDRPTALIYSLWMIGQKKDYIYLSFKPLFCPLPLLREARAFT